MALQRRIIWIGTGLLALGSAMALAQSAPNEPSPPVSDVINAPAAQNDEPTSVQNSPSEAAPDTNVEDAPIEVPAQGRSDWAPDIDLDALGSQASAPTTQSRRPSRPRKILSDAGDNVAGNWSQAGNNADASIIVRSKRRERPIDPEKRSELTKLSRIMGALHALRVSCAGRDDQTYRSRMATMLDLEAPNNGVLRDPLVDAFNGGFQAYGRGAGACPGDARAQEANLAKDGLQVAKALSARYRPPPPVATVLPPANQPRINVANTRALSSK